jgi:citronellol/citronellal dehydrogenase
MEVIARAVLTPEPMFEKGLFQGEVALITGGGTGIGFEVAKELGRLGAKIAICGRRKEPLDAAVAELGKSGIEAFSGTCDIRDAEQVKALVDSVKAKFGRIDILVNNAGGQFPIAAEALSPRGFEAVVRNNLIGTWIMTHAVATTAFIPQKRGRIVNVVAQMKRGFPGMVHTGAARAGVENMTKTLAIEWAAYGVRVNAVAPGVIKTTGTDQYPQEILEAAANRVPLRRIGHAHEVSHLIVYLASRQADFITGQTMFIDGGQSLYGDTWVVPEDVPKYVPET